MQIIWVSVSIVVSDFRLACFVFFSIKQLHNELFDMSALFFSLTKYLYKRNVKWNQQQNFRMQCKQFVFAINSCIFPMEYQTSVHENDEKENPRLIGPFCFCFICSIYIFAECLYRLCATMPLLIIYGVTDSMLRSFFIPQVVWDNYNESSIHFV